MRSLWILVVAACIGLLLMGSVSTSSSPVNDKYKIKLRVFYRAFCPACQWFVGDPLLELIRNEQFRNILDFAIFPVAGMSDVQGDLICEGGRLECTGHRWQVCAINKDKEDVVKYVGSVACIEGDESGEVGDWETKITNCFTNEEREELQECMDKRADVLMRQMMVEPGFDDVLWMPYTSVNGMVLGSASRGVGLSELQSHICKQFQGPKSFYPEACVALVGEQEIVAKEENDKSGEEPLTIKTVTNVEPAPASLAPKAVDRATPAAMAKNTDNDNDGEDNKVPRQEDTTDRNKVRLEVYWRAFCPGCMSFITRPLYKLLQDEEFRDIIDFRPVPAAGTYYDPTTEQFMCNKGMVECVGHQLLSCVIHEFPDVEKQIEHLACLERRDNKGASWEFIVNKCFSANSVEYNTMKQCFDSKSTDLLRAHIAVREQLTLPWVPYVLLDGRAIGDAWTGIGFKQLQDEMCASYKGSIEFRPNACSPKRLRGGEDKEAAVAETEDKEEKMIKPCPPKKDGEAATAAGGAKYDDAPGAGFRRPADAPVEGKADENAEDVRALGAEDRAFKHSPPSSSFSMQSLLFPLGCFALLAFIAKRLSGDHKKYA